MVPQPWHSCPGQWWDPHPWKDLKPLWMWHLGMWFNAPVAGGVISDSFLIISGDFHLLHPSKHPEVFSFIPFPLEFSLWCLTPAGFPLSSGGGSETSVTVQFPNTPPSLKTQCDFHSTFLSFPEHSCHFLNIPEVLL